MSTLIGGPTTSTGYFIGFTSLAVFITFGVATVYVTGLAAGLRGSASTLLWVCDSAHHPQRSQIRQRVSHSSSESFGLPVLAGMPESIFFLMFIFTPLGMGNLVLVGLSLLRLFAYPLFCLPFHLFPLLSALYVSWLSGGLSREALREACPFANASQFFDMPIASKLGQHKRSALEARCIISNWYPSDGLTSVGKHSSGGIPQDRPMKSSKLSPQQMAEWDEVGGSSGRIPPQCVPIKSLGGALEILSWIWVRRKRSILRLVYCVVLQLLRVCSVRVQVHRWRNLRSHHRVCLCIFPSSSTVWTSGTSKGLLAVELR